jgi:hypothetical protein
MAGSAGTRVIEQLLLNAIELHAASIPHQRVA